MSVNEKMKPWSRRITEKEWILIFDPKPKITIPSKRQVAVTIGRRKQGKREEE